MRDGGLGMTAAPRPWSDAQVARVMRAMSAVDRMMPKIRYTEAGCAEWTGALNSKGYGVVSVAGRRELAHRVSFEAHVGPIPDGLQVDHVCRNIVCVLPTHLEAVTDAENRRRRYAAPLDVGAVSA